MKIMKFLILLLLLLQQIALADTPKLQHFPDGATTILTPEGEDLGIRFRLKSVLLDGKPIQLTNQPLIQDSQLGYTIHWNDVISERWLENDSHLNNNKMELVVVVSQMTDQEQNLVVEYLFDSVNEHALIVSGHSNFHIDDNWSLGTNGMWILENDCEFTQYKHEKKEKIHRFEINLKPGLNSIHIGIDAQLRQRGFSAGKPKHWPNQFYLRDDQLVVSDHNGYVSYFNLKGDVFKFKQRLEHPDKSLGETDFGCQVHLGKEHLVTSDCEAGKLFFYQNVNQLWQPNGEIKNRLHTTNTGGYHWSGQYLYGYSDMAFSEAESLINTFTYKNKHWRLNTVFDAESVLQHGSLEAYVVDENLMVVMTQAESYTYHIHILERKKSNWILSDETVLYEQGSVFAGEQLHLSDGLLAIPMGSDDPKVWLFDLTKKLNRQKPIKLEDMAGTSPKQHFDNTGFGQAIANAGDWIYVLSPSRQERSEILNETMPKSQCISDTWGRVDAWQKQGKSWNHAGFIPTKLSQYGSYDLIQDQGQVYWVQGKRGSSQFELIPISKGKAIHKNSILITDR